jgi:Icc protein
MGPSLLAHISDLHLGRSASNDAAVERLVRQLHRVDPDQLVISGDVTHRGRRQEMARFESLFSPWLERGTAVVVPGNHDRVGEDAGADLMGGERVRIHESGGAWLIRVDSTGPHNRSVFRCDGALCEHVLAQIDEALAAAPKKKLVALVLHHHVLPLPEENWPERLANWLGLPHADELALGPQLLERAQGRCDLVLHGHRHHPRAFHVDHGARRLSVFNAGSSPELGRFRVFEHAEGVLHHRPRWVGTVPRGERPAIGPVAYAG